MAIPFIVILTGAGISAESGLATFRAQNGLWEDHAIEDVASYEGYKRNPQQVHQFYNQLRQKLLSTCIKPNAAHYALAKLENAFSPNNVLLITQNVDNLHERAGSQHIIHMHGELLKVRNEKTGEILDCYDDTDFKKNPLLRPHIVWFGERPLDIDHIYSSVMRADYFIAIGTSGHVYPAASFVELAKNNGSQTIELNLAPSLNKNVFSQRQYGLATAIVPAFVDQLIKDLVKVT